jgi:hypothetical protein
MNQLNFKKIFLSNKHLLNKEIKKSIIEKIVISIKLIIFDVILLFCSYNLIKKNDNDIETIIGIILLLIFIKITISELSEMFSKCIIYDNYIEFKTIFGSKKLLYSDINDIVFYNYQNDEGSNYSSHYTFYKTRKNNEEDEEETFKLYVCNKEAIKIINDLSKEINIKIKAKTL